MGQKVHPHGLRVGVIKDWDSRWFVKDEKIGEMLVEDYNIRKYLKGKLYSAGIPKIEIERSTGGNAVRIVLWCAKPGLVIGRGGAEIDKLKKELGDMTGKRIEIKIAEVKSIDMDSQLVAESIAAQLEKRIAFRRAMKQAIGRTMRCGAKGIKIMVSGRLNGAEIARSETYHEGTIPLQTLRADIDYGFAEANTTYGKLGIKVWIYKGEILKDKKEMRSLTSLENNKERAKGERKDRADKPARAKSDRPRRAPKKEPVKEGGADDNVTA